MKTNKKNEENLDEIVFSNRNHEYGAYALRMKYPAYLYRGLSIAVIIMLVSVTIPLVAGYYGKHKSHMNEITVTATMDKLIPPPVDVPPPPPPPTDPVQRAHPFTIPQVVDMDDPGGSFVTGGDDGSSGNKPIDTTERNVVTPPPTPVVDPPRKQEIYLSVQEMPSYEGGEEARLKFLQDNIHYPALARETGIQGVVYIQFVVDEHGGMSQMVLQRGLGGGCDEEAMRVLKMMHWNPGKQDGRPVPVRFTIPIRFTLSH